MKVKMSLTKLYNGLARVLTRIWRLGRKMQLSLISLGMTLKTALAIVSSVSAITLSSLLSACASFAPPATSSTSPAVNAAPSAAPTKLAAASVDTKEKAETEDDAETKIDPTLPKLELTPDMMFKILGSEVAAKRGEWKTGFVTMLSLAQQTRDPRLAKRAMELALAEKQMTEAMAGVRLWRELAPQSEDATQYFMALAILQDKVAEVMPIFAQRLKSTPIPSRGSAILASYQRYLNQGKDKVALFAQLETLYAPYADVLETHLVLAQAAVAKGDSARARVEAKAALAIKPDSELSLLTYIYLLDNQAEAQKLIIEFLQKYPQAKEVRASWARTLLERKQYPESRAQYQLLVKEKSHELPANYALGVIGVYLKEYDAAETHLKRYLELLIASKGSEADTSRVLVLLGQVAEERGNLPAALQWLKQAQNSDGSNYVYAISRHAQILAKQNKLEEARTLLQTAVTSNEAEKAQLLQLEAQLLRDASQVLSAFSLLEGAIKTYPNNADLLYDHAMMAEKLERLAEMEASLRKVMKISPENHHAYNALGYSLAERNIRLPEALVLIEKALKMAPDDPFILDSMGWVQFRLGKLKEAEVTLRRAYSLRADAEIAVHLGEVLWQNGQKEAAQQIWRDAKSKDPANDSLKNTLARLNVSL